ncbi:hypothetical protein [Neolewinella antarctica]|uniref:Uncharacterized protein n=1 Tax=Neolewinella antarctica TaxID=442734 RepID=A0ABX0X5R5_9BACT|nr:hypothetical protein [Neolewinella antarctica]NJC24548.1 hypothetical protein [Neolewinella antarctica]
MTTKHLLSSLALLAGTGLSAQSDNFVDTEIVLTPNYFIVVLFGVMLAIGFQFLLTALSIAIGVSAIPNLKESYVESRYGASSTDDSDWNETNSTNTGVMISSALGIWNVVTAAVSLFGATALALTLTPAVNNVIAITLGLTIWAVFYLLMFYLEGKMAGTLIGSLINTAVAGLRAGADTVKGLFTPSAASQVESVADNTIEKFRSEMTSAFNADGISDAINQFTSTVGKKVDKVGNKLDKASDKVVGKIGDVPSYDKLKADLQQTLSQASKDSGSNPAKWTAIQSAIQTVVDGGGDDADSGSKDDGGKSDRIKQLKQLVSQFQKDNQGESEGGMSTDEMYEKYTGKLTDYLNGATPESFDAKKLGPKIQELLDDPQGTSSDAIEKVKGMDKESIIKILSNNTSLEKKQLEGYANQLTQVLGKLPTSVQEALDNDTLKMVQDKVMSFVNGVQDQVGGSGSGEASASSGIDFNGLKNQFMSIINNPADSFDTVNHRIKNYRRDDLVNTLVANTSLSHADIDKAVAQVEGAQNTVKDQLQAAADAANGAKNQAARRAVIEADGARKAAVAAAWWLFTAIIVSGAAAIVGSLTGI